MTKAEFEKGKQQIWANWISRWGSVSRDVRQDIEELHFGQAEPKYSREALTAFADKIPKCLVMLEHHLNSLRVRQDLISQHDNVSRAKYRKCFDRRLHLVEFVLDGNLPFLMRLELRSFKHKRIKWVAVSKAWNETHPYDTMTPKVLKVAFYRALREPELKHEYFARRRRELEDIVAPLMKVLDAITELQNQGYSDKDIARKLKIKESVLRKPSKEEEEEIAFLLPREEREA